MKNCDLAGFLPYKPASEKSLHKTLPLPAGVANALALCTKAGNKKKKNLSETSETFIAKSTAKSADLDHNRSIASHPASTTHSKLSEAERNAAGITPGLIRFSLAGEYLDDIKDDILQAAGYC